MRPHVVFLLLCASCSVPPTPAHRDPTPLPASFTGRIVWEGHFERPLATRSRDVEVHLSQVGQLAMLELIEADRPGGPTERTLLVLDQHGQCWRREGDNERFVVDRDGGEHLVRTMQKAVAGGDVDAPAAWWQHPRLGDLQDLPQWKPSSADDHAELHVHWYRHSDQAELVLRRSADATGSDVASALAAGDVGVEQLAAATPPATFRTLAPGVHEVTLTDVETRSLAIEFADHLLLCETSLDNAAGERLLACLDEHLPGKPVRYVLFGHYHPHYTGGLRPVMARGAIVVAPPLGAAWAEQIAARSFCHPPDALTAALASSGQPPIVERFVGQRTFRDDDNELVAIDIGADSHHTAEYVLFWLPRQQLLFEGDLGWHTIGDAIRPSGNRARGLVKAIDDRALPVVTLVQGWSPRGRSTLPLADLRTLLAQ